MCLASILHHEARGESVKGKRAVLDNVLYRMQKYNKSCVDVVTAPRQYSGFTRDKVYKVSKEALTNYWQVCKVKPVCRECEWYHRWDVKPIWRHKLVRVQRIDSHIFYKSKEVS